MIQKNPFKSMVLLLPLFSIPVWSTAINAEEGVKPSANIEADTVAVRPIPTEDMEKSALIEALHEARLAGEMVTVHEIEAMLRKKFARNESASLTILIPSKTCGVSADLTITTGGQNLNNCLIPPADRFGEDVKVFPLDLPDMEWNQTMVSDSVGNLYVAWQDNSMINDIIYVYKSTDCGETWMLFGLPLDRPGMDLMEPSLAVGEGAGGNKLLLAYIVDDAIPRPEVAILDLDMPVMWDVRIIPLWGGLIGYAKPVINTDSIHFGEWYAYLTCEGTVFAGDINVCFWKSTDGGMTWIDEQIVLGSADADAWRNVDCSYGTSHHRVFLTAYNDDHDTLHVVTSDNFGASWNPVITVFALPFGPHHAVDPEIAAAVNLDNVMICCTIPSFGGDDNIGYVTSNDAGDTWGPLMDMVDCTTEEEWAVSLTANEGGQDWHLAYTSQYTFQNRVFYTRCPQDLTDPWTSPVIVDDLGTAGGPFFSKKGIASNWADNSACIAWADNRDGAGDFDCYLDHRDNLGLMLDNPEIVAFDGGSCNFTLTAGADNAGRLYWVVGSFSGYDPGFPLFGGGTMVPVNWDILTVMTINFPNTPLFTAFRMPLDPLGYGTATLNVPSMDLVVPVTLHFAFFLWGHPWEFASNAVRMDLIP
jgi:hypothetical protein